MMTWWVLQDPGDPGPYAVICKDEQGLPRMFVPGEGLVDWPWAAMWTDHGEPGARRISEQEAVALMNAGVGRIPDGFSIDAGRGTAPTIQPPGASNARASP